MFTQLFNGINVYLKWALNIHYPWGAGMAARVLNSATSIQEQTIAWSEITSGSGFGKIVSGTNNTTYVFDNVRNLRVGQRIIFPAASGGQKEGIIASISGMTVTFVTAPATPVLANGLAFYAMPAGRAEGSDAPAGRGSAKREYTNSMQIFQDVVHFSGNRLAQALADPVSTTVNNFGQPEQTVSLPREVLDVMNQQVQELYRSIWHGTPEQAGNPKQFKGLRHFFENPDAVYGFPTTVTGTAASLTAPTSAEIEKIIGSMIEQRQNQGGVFDANTRIIVPTLWITALKGSTSRYLVQRTDSDAKLGINPAIYADKDVECIIEGEKHIAGLNEGYILNDTGFSFKYNADRFMKAEQLAKTGDSEKIQIITEGGVEFYGIQGAVRGKLQ